MALTKTDRFTIICSGSINLLKNSKELMPI